MRPQDAQVTSQSASRPGEADTELLRRLRLKDRNAFTMVVQTYSTMLTRIAWLYLGDAHLAEDAVQEALLAAWDSASRKREGTSLKAWLVGILANRCHKHVRSAGRRHKREQLAAKGEVAISGTDPDATRLRAVQDALLSLESLHREVVILRFWQGLSVEETAVALSIPAGTVKSRCHAAVANLREMMRAEA